MEWFRLPRGPDDPAGVAGWVGDRQLMIMIDRGDYWQCGYVIGKGRTSRCGPPGSPRSGTGWPTLVPWLGDRADALASFDDVKLLNVRLERLRRWYADGLLLIGDAAHAMSPVGGVGINLAVQDAVAAARILGPVLRAGSAVTTDPSAGGAAAAGLGGSRSSRPSSGWPTRDWPVPGPPGGCLPTPPRHPSVPAAAAAAAAHRFPVLQGLPARAIAIGPLPEHAPDWASAALHHPAPPPTCQNLVEPGLDQV